MTEERDIGGARVLIVDDLRAFADETARVVVDACVRSIAARGSFSIALTGGSTPSPMHRALAEGPSRAQIDWPRVRVLFGDERAVPPEAKESNYRAASVDLLQHVPLLPQHVHRMRGDASDLHAAAHDYENTLRLVCDAKPDLVCVGIGKDAHIFSLFPTSPAIDEKDALVVASLHPPMSPALSRITMTPPMLTRADLVLAIATGPEKRDAVAHALQGEDDAHRFPAQLIRRAPKRVWVVDRAAAAGLTLPG